MSYLTIKLVNDIKKLSVELLPLMETGEEIDKIRELIEQINEIVKNIELAAGSEIYQIAPNFGRHLGWLNRRLREGKPEEAKQDVIDFIERDLDRLKQNILALFNMNEKHGLIDVEEETKDGGFAKVIIGYDPNRGQKVACKELFSSTDFRQKYGEDEESFFQRFRREVRLMTEFNHPNIMPIYEAQLERKPYWFTMPLADCSLGEWVEKNPDLSDDVKEEVFLQILEGVKYLHNQSKYHRDLAPSNILMFNTKTKEAPDVKLADFGLAKDMNSNSYNTLSNQKGYGHKEFCAPEQSKSLKHATHLSDIYSLGGLLYFLFKGKDPSNRFHEISKYQRIVLRAMDQKPENRYQSVDDLRDDFIESAEKRRREPKQTFRGISDYKYTDDVSKDAANISELLILWEEESDLTVYTRYVRPFLSIEEPVLKKCCQEQDGAMARFTQSLEPNLDALSRARFPYDDTKKIDYRLRIMYYACISVSNKVEIVKQLLRNAIYYNRLQAKYDLPQIFEDMKGNKELADGVANAIEDYFPGHTDLIRDWLRGKDYPGSIRSVLDDL